MAIDLFGGSDTGADEADLSTINVDHIFAKRLEHNKRREARQRQEELKRKGLADDDDDNDDTEEEINLPSKKDLLKFLEMLDRVKKNDPEILRTDTKIYPPDEEERAKRRVVKKERPLYLKDVNYRHLIEEGPEFEHEPLKYDSKVYNEEQAEAIKAFLEADKDAFASVGGEEEEEDDILKVKEKPGEAEKDEDAEKIDHSLDECFGNNMNEKEKLVKEYLRNIIRIDEEKDKKPSFDNISDEEDELDKQDKYEAE